mmetsp:Transcript_19355/g.62178  ORF Transcript_19355/g.62178 Transcript_19355/m.62178 type:complete len:162 (-) Transcript_19355:45-530(-)
MAMATDNEIAALKEEIKDANLEIKQVTAALGGNADGAGNYAGYAKLAFEERKTYLEKRLSELESRLKDLRKKEAMWLEHLSQLPQQLPAQQTQPPQQEQAAASSQFVSCFFSKQSHRCLVPRQRTKTHRRQYQRRRRPLSSTQPTEISREASRLSPITEEP